MLTQLQINQTIDEKIRATLANTTFSAVKIVAVDDPIVRPAIQIKIENSSVGLADSRCREMALSFQIHFFAADPNQYHVDNMNMQNLIETALLGGIYVDGAYIPIDLVKSTVLDTVLICSFDIYTVELLPDTDTSEITEELKFREVTK